MKVSELGEFGLIDRLAEMSGKAVPGTTRERLVIGIGDDAAAWKDGGTVQLATTDVLVQNVHFSLEYTDWASLGWRALAVNLSDIAAMGGVPRYALVSLSLPGETEVGDVTSLYEGLLEVAVRHEVAVIGGNISRAPLLVINITVVGAAVMPDGRLLTRSAARAGDSIAVTGCPGGSAAGLALLRQGKGQAAEAASLKEAFLRPVPRLAEGQLLVSNGVAAAIDISDGLLADLGHICRASGVGARVNADAVPVSPAARQIFADKALEMALSGGEDYELLFTAPAGVMEKVMAAGCQATVIGEITREQAGKVVLVDGQGKEIRMEQRGWDHFVTGRK